MPQPKSSRTSKPAGAAKKPSARKPAAKKSSASKPAAKQGAAAKRSPAKKTAPARKAATAKKATSARKPATAKRGSSARRPAASRSTGRSSGRSRAQSGADDALRTNLAQLREVLSSGVLLTTKRLQEAMDEAVRGGHMTRRSAEDLAKGLLDAGRKQTQDVMTELEQLLDRRPGLGSASSAVRERGDRVLREVDRVRRTAGLGPSFPILGFDDLTAGQVTSRLADLNAPQLRKVRDHERRNANRKSVLDAIEKALR